MNAKQAAELARPIIEARRAERFKELHAEVAEFLTIIRKVALNGDTELVWRIEMTADQQDYLEQQLGYEVRRIENGYVSVSWRY